MPKKITKSAVMHQPKLARKKARLSEEDQCGKDTGHTISLRHDVQGRVSEGCDSVIISDSARSLSSRTASITESVFSMDSVFGSTNSLNFDETPCSPIEVEHEIGRGEFGTVYSVKYDASSGVQAHLAFKVPQRTSSIDNEKRIMAVVGEHPNIAECYGETTISDKTGLLFELVSGPQLDTLLAALDDARLPIGEYLNALKYLEHQKLAAAAHLEEHGVSHSDLKPSNFLLNAPTGELKLIDFGQSCLKDEEVNCGHESFAPPEGLKTLGGAHGHNVLGKPSVDSYALGQMMYRTITGYDTTDGKPFFNDAKIDDLPVSMRVERAFLIHQAMKSFMKPNEDGSYKTVMPTDVAAIHEHACMIESARLKSEDMEEILDSAEKLKPELVHLTNLINGLMHPKPELRLTAKQAIRHPWFTETPVDPDKARATLSALNTKP